MAKTRTVQTVQTKYPCHLCGKSGWVEIDGKVGGIICRDCYDERNQQLEKERLDDENHRLLCICRSGFSG